MRIREPAIPLALWICAAICGHMVFGGGGAVVGKLEDDHSALAILGHQARESVRHGGQTLEIDTLAERAAKPADDEPKPDELKPPEPPKPERPKVMISDPIKEIAAAAEKKKEEEKKKLVLVPEKDDPLKKLDPPKLLANDKRIAVVQHAKKNQEDNPTASHIADEANHVEKEEVSTLTSHDQNDANPTPGGNHSGPKGAPGDSERNKIAESEEHKGEKNRGPGERGTELEIQKDPMPERPTGPVAIAAKEASVVPPRGGGDGRAVSTPQAPKAPELAPGGQEAPSPEVVQGTNGAWTFNPIRPNAGSGTLPNAAQGSATKTPQTAPGSTKWLGLGGQVGPGQMNINLTHQGVIATVGQDQLKKEREADGERRKSEHRGSWTASSFERWRSAIENYTPTVKAGNQTALNTAAVPFASYINHVHNRIHPIFADNFLSSLDSLPSTHPLNNIRIFTRLEIVVTKEGRLVKMGVVRASGVTAFDIAALDSVSRASPFGPAPSAIHSPDGNVYLHWEFHRDESACTTANARPFIVNVPAPGPPVEPPPGDPNAPPSKERSTPPPVNLHEVREGLLETPWFRGG